MPVLPLSSEVPFTSSATALPVVGVMSISTRQYQGSPESFRALAVALVAIVTQLEPSWCSSLNLPVVAVAYTHTNLTFPVAPVVRWWKYTMSY